MSIFNYERNAKERHERVCALKELYRSRIGMELPSACENYLIEAMIGIQKRQDHKLDSNISSYINYVNANTDKIIVFLAVLLAMCTNWDDSIRPDRASADRLIKKYIEKYCKYDFITFLWDKDYGIFK